MTIKDLAAKTGYSVGTISRVLNNQSHVSEQAREVILRAAQECGFHLNANAKQLKQQHSNSILVICKGRANELFDTMLVTLQSRAAQAGFPLIVDYLDESENVVKRALRLCPEKKAPGHRVPGRQPGGISGRFRQNRSALRACHRSGGGPAL